MLIFHLPFWHFMFSPASVMLSSSFLWSCLALQVLLERWFACLTDVPLILLDFLLSLYQIWSLLPYLCWVVCSPTDILISVASIFIIWLGSLIQQCEFGLQGTSLELAVNFFDCICTLITNWIILAATVSKCFLTFLDINEMCAHWKILFNDYAFIGGIPFCFNKISCRCQGWWYNHSLWKKSWKLFARLRGSDTNGVLWSVSCWCWSVWPFTILFKLPCLTSNFEELVLVQWFLNRFPELRDALEKLQLNDAALKVHSFLLAEVYDIILNLLLDFYLLLNIFPFFPSCSICIVVKSIIGPFNLLPVYTWISVVWTWNFKCYGLWFSLWVSRFTPHGNCSGSAKLLVIISFSNCMSI